MVFHGADVFQWYFAEVAVFQCYRTNFPYIKMSSFLKILKQYVVKLILLD